MCIGKTAGGNGPSFDQPNPKAIRLSPARAARRHRSISGRRFSSFWRVSVLRYLFWPFFISESFAVLEGMEELIRIIGPLLLSEQNNFLYVTKPVCLL
jgi:hypothetical protein